ncbi:MAG: cation-translocating P-type ATPase [Oscillospiraceae bacterium]|nr:cation-translocating P-type ATPase [Oscillospiraceae bacterium]
MEHTQSAQEVLTRFNSDAQRGLTPVQVTANAEMFGRNELTRDKPVSLLRRIGAAMRDPMLIMLAIAGLIALGVNITLYVTGGEADFLECAGILIAIGFCVGITVFMEGKSAKAFEALAKINDDIDVKVIRDGKPQLLNRRELVAGDIVSVETGVRVPADGRLIESVSLQADESSLTGESAAVKKDSEAVFPDNTPVAERANMLYCGSFVTNGNGLMAVTAVGGHTEFGKIAAELATVHAENTPLQAKLAKLGKTIAAIGIGAAVLAFIIQIVLFLINGTATFANIADAFITSVVLIVAAVPEGMPALIAVSLAISVIKMSKQNALVKKMVACETVGCIDVVCSDKTGTLTENRMTVVNEINGERMIRNICINSTADIDPCAAPDAQRIGNPTECALLTKCGDYAAIRRDADVVSVVPFSSDNKYMATTVREGDSIVTYVKGSPEKIMDMCRLGEGNSAQAAITAYQEKACRIIAFAHKVNDGEYVWDNFAAITDPVRADVYTAVEDCRSAGIALKILTGDNILTATAIGQELGILQNGATPQTPSSAAGDPPCPAKFNGAYEASQLENLTDEELSALLPDIRIIARSTPTIKMRVVKLLKAAGHVVAVTGDGINDAPAIKNADVGIAMGVTGTEVSKAAADIVLLDDSFATIAKAVKWGRGIYENFQRFITFQLTVNVSTMAIVLIAVALGLGSPFTALQLLFINIIMDGPPAIALGLEPIRSDLMKHRPVKRNAPIISGAMLVRIVVMSVFIVGVSLSQNLLDFMGAGDLAFANKTDYTAHAIMNHLEETKSEYRHTVFFALFVMFKLFNALNCREIGMRSVFAHFFANRAFFAAVIGAFVAAVLCIQYGGDFFHTVPLTWQMWLKIVAVAASAVAVSELLRIVGIFHKKFNGASVSLEP